MKDKLNHEAQRKIYSLITKNPGITSRKLSELLQQDIPQIERLLDYLERNKIITVVQDLGYKRYYIEKQHIPERELRTIEIRRKIYETIAKNPGIHLSNIADLLQMRISLADYHLLQMEQQQEIMSIKSEKGYYKRYYIKNSELGIHNKKLLGLLRQEIPLKIVLLLLRNKQMRHKDIHQYLNIASSTLSYHLTKLIKQSVIAVQTYGSDKGYVLTNRKEIFTLLMKYELHQLTQDFIDIWENLEL